MEKFTIIVIDDDITYRNYIVKLLSQAGYKVIYARDGKDGLEKIKSFKIDIILLDINLPEGRESGFEICREIKQMRNLNTIPVLFLTVTYNPEYVKKGFEVGGVDYVVKSSGSIELLPRIKAHMRNFLNTRAIMLANEQLEILNHEAQVQIRNFTSELIIAKKSNNETQIVELLVRLEEKNNQIEFQQETIKLLASRPININLVNDFHGRVKEFVQNITIEEAKEITYYFENAPVYKRMELSDYYKQYDAENDEIAKSSLKERINTFINEVFLPIGYAAAGSAAFEIFRLLIND